MKVWLAWISIGSLHLEMTAQPAFPKLPKYTATALKEDATIEIVNIHGNGFRLVVQ